MNNLPNVKTHPVLMTLITMTFMLCFGLICTFSGYWIRVQLESRAELAVVVDDGEFMQKLEVKVQSWTDEFLKSDESFHNKNKIPDCLAKPMPRFYHDDDEMMRGIVEDE